MKINLQWLWRHVPRFELVLLALFAFPGSFEQVANGWTFGQIPAMVAAQARERWRFVLIAVGLYVGTYVFSFGFQFLMQDVIRRANIALKSTMLRGSFASGEDQNVGLNRMTGDAVKIQDQYFNVIAAIITAACTAIACAWLVFTSNWQLGLIKIAFSFLAMLPMAFGAKFMARLGQRWSSATRKR
ncbi:ABC transporter ATP-binding protein [Lacticaseibacillus sharpeae]|uniref:ABC transporter ATP-binding protein n=1 Tax=Lacticaseibacillus sharpeae TaxID=1626 RepID=UPI00138F51A6|nr:ABC transporter ATP-binding protein [Lacticaseibacillus sharpeae]